MLRSGGAGGGERPTARTALSMPPAHRLHELTQKEGHPARHAQARVDERGIGSPTESRLQELDNGGSRQRLELEHTMDESVVTVVSSSASVAASRGRIATTA